MLSVGNIEYTIFFFTLSCPQWGPTHPSKRYDELNVKSDLNVTLIKHSSHVSYCTTEALTLQSNIPPKNAFKCNVTHPPRGKFVLLIVLNALDVKAFVIDSNLPW